MRAVLLGLAVAVIACGGQDAAEDATQEQSGPSGDAAGPTGNATINGQVAFTGAVPANPAIDMAEEPACRRKHASPPRDPEYVVSDGRLGNVFVTVRSGLPAGAKYQAPSDPVVLDQDGCIYQPRVFGVMVGQPVEIRNSDPVLHNIKAVPSKNRGFNISQPSEGMRTTRTFNTPETMIPLECNVHGWMNAFAGVTSHPFFAVTGNDGTFTIRNLPAGTYELEAWHEKLGTRTTKVTVPEGGTVDARFSFAATAT